MKKQQEDVIMAKAEKELQELKEKVENLSNELKELPVDEIKQVSGGGALKRYTRIRNDDSSARQAAAKAETKQSGTSFFDTVERIEYIRNLK